MAKKSMIMRQGRRAKLVAKYATRRARLKAIIVDGSTSDEERLEAVAKLASMPRDASPTRLRNRCAITGRPRGYYRKFGLARNQLRESTMSGQIPGLRKASW
jgi:small subunit ribosomal protein S14